MSKFISYRLELSFSLTSQPTAKCHSSKVFKEFTRSTNSFRTNLAACFRPSQITVYRLVTSAGRKCPGSVALPELCLVSTLTVCRKAGLAAAGTLLLNDRACETQKSSSSSDRSSDKITSRLETALLLLLTQIQQRLKTTAVPYIATRGCKLAWNPDCLPVTHFHT